MTETQPGVSLSEYEDRLAATRSAMHQRGLAALLLAGPENIYYLTGLSHQGHFAFTLLIVPPSGPLLLVARQMERFTLAHQVPACTHVPYADGQDPAAAVADALHRAVGDGSRVGVEMSSTFLPVDIWLRLTAAADGVEFVDGSGVVDEIRHVKSPAEIGHTRRAAETSSAAMAAAMAAAQIGATERDIAQACYDAMIGAGSEFPSIAPFIRTQERFRQEHVTWTDRVLRPGDSVLIELSGSIGRYHAPMTRTLHLGDPPGGTTAALARAGLDAVAAALRPGVSAPAVYQTWKTVIDDGLGHRNYHRHHCGYLVGIGFPPTWTGGPSVLGLRPDSDLTIEEGMTFHVLSWLFGQGPVDHAVSDTVLVTRDGGEILTVVS